MALSRSWQISMFKHTKLSCNVCSTDSKSRPKTTCSRTLTTSSRSSHWVWTIRGSNHSLITTYSCMSYSHWWTNMSSLNTARHFKTFRKMSKCFRLRRLRTIVRWWSTGMRSLSGCLEESKLQMTVNSSHKSKISCNKLCKMIKDKLINSTCKKLQLNKTTLKELISLSKRLRSRTRAKFNSLKQRNKSSKMQRTKRIPKPWKPSSNSSITWPSIASCTWKT